MNLTGRILASAIVTVSLAANLLAAEFVWIEGEAAKANVETKAAGWGRPHFLSEEKWLHISVEAGNVEKQLPNEGIILSYAFKTPKAAKYEIWNRIGFEFARSPFDWRIGEGEWKQIAPDMLTTDLMELATWCEVAWLHMGNLDLPAGDHTLQIRLPKGKDDKGKPQRVLYASDAIVIHEGGFKPNSKFKPGQTGRGAKDEEAAKNVFKLPEAPAAQRASVELTGIWEVARLDEQLPGEVAEPIKDMPADVVWKAIPIPSDKNKVREDLIFAHRLWYRTKIDVPASMAGRAFFIDFPYNNLNTTVYVNGVFCGFEKNPFCRFQIDVSKGIKPGQTNEILVGIRDAWYGRSADTDRPLKLRKTFNYPIGHFHNGFQQMDYPVWNCSQSGIISTPTFIAAGGVYASDVFAKPSVAKKQLEAEITLSNTTSANAAGEIRWEAVNDKTGQAEKTFAAKPFTVAAGKSETIALADAWADAKVWWPDAPNMYRLRTIVAIGGQPVDVKETLFGFREWRIDGIKFTLNGVVWHMWADLIGVSGSPEKWLEAYRRTNQRTTRVSTAGQASNDSRWMGMEPHKALEFLDRNGVVVRRNTTVDGEVIGYQFSEDDPETVKKQNGSKVKIALMKNWADQCAAQVKGERNHPSIQIWTIENEFAFINLVNLLGSSPMMDEYEKWITNAAEATLKADPTRSVMIDGGGATKANTLPVHGDHYVATLDVRYPDLAYEPFVEGGGRGRWKWDMTRPRFLGEDFYASGINPADYAMWGGEVAFQGKAATKDAIATVYRMLNEGYRWGGHQAAWHFWLGGEGGPRQWVANAPRAALVRQWDWTFGSGQTMKRSFGVFNDTQHPDPITFTRTLKLAGTEVYTKTTAYDVKPGTAVKFDEAIALPAVTDRQEGELLLTLTVGGQEVFRDVKSISILPPVKAASAAGGLAVYDPSGETIAFLKTTGLAFTAVNTLENLPDAKVLVIGRDAIKAAESTSTALAAWASAGRAVVVLDQSHPLKYQALPAEMDLAPRSKRSDFGDEVPLAEGRTAFIEDASHPALAGLKDKDFFTWGPDHIVYRNAYVKPTRGGKSLVQVGPRLEHSALVEVPVGKGILYLSQLGIGGKLADNATAQHVLANLVKHAATYKQEFSGVAAVVQDEQVAKAIDAIGLQYSKAANVLAALADTDKKVALISATPANLATLAGAMDKVNAFWQRGGTIVFTGLTPEGLADYNRIVGVNHVIRPFGCERVTFPAVRHPLTAGLTTGDIVLLSGKRIFGWTRDEYVAEDVFTHVVDLDEMAPFGKSGFHAYANIVNGFVGSDGWPLIIDFPFPADGSPFDIVIDLPKEETIVEYTHDASMNYSPTTKIALLFDGKDRVEFAMQPNGDPQTFAIDPPRKAKQVTVQIAGWEHNPSKNANIGIDNIFLKVQRDEAWKATVKPMLNLGGMVHYARGNGSVVLCNLKFQETEAVPVNLLKKRTILATVLRNLKSPFAGGRTVIAGANLDYRPIDIHTKATTYKDERGWFGDKRKTFKGLPEGEHTFAGVKYSIYEMPTSPVPQVLMLGGNRVPGNLPEQITGIPINAKADALFFLHTARIDQRMNDRDHRDNKRFELFKYIIHYADGQTTELPIISEFDIEHYAQAEPKALPGAQIAWTAKLEGSNESAVAYAKQWNNPRPDVEIRSVDMVYGADKAKGVPALIAITAVK